MSEVECSMCGRNGGPFEGCSMGCNGDTRFSVPRAYTLSEIQSGRAPKDDRYGPSGQLGPKTHDPTWAGHDSSPHGEDE